MHVHVPVQLMLALFPSPFEGGGKGLFVHAHNTPNILWNQDTFVACLRYVTSRSVA